MKKNIFISMEREIFRGNILDIGMENQGIFYNIYKQYNDDINVEYISGKEGKKNIHENFYDSCILFFSLNSIWLKNKKRELIKDIYKYLNKDGIIYIWDIDKGYGKIFNGHIKVVIPGSKIKHMDIKELNILKDISKENTIKLLENYFDIIDSKSSDGIYYIKARKKLMLSNVNNVVLQKENETKEKIGVN